MMHRSLSIRLYLLLSSLAIIFGFQLPYAQAATRLLSSFEDIGTGSLRNTIAAAVSGDTISFGLSGIVRLTSAQILIDKNLTIDIIGTPSVSISGTNVSRIFQVSAGVTL